MKQNKYYDKTEAYAIRRSAIPAALMQIKGLARFDSKDAASVFFARELDYIKSQAYETEYPDLMAFQLFPIDMVGKREAERIGARAEQAADSPVALPIGPIEFYAVHHQIQKL